MKSVLIEGQEKSRNSSAFQFFNFFLSPLLLKSEAEKQFVTLKINCYEHEKKEASAMENWTFFRESQRERDLFSQKCR